MLYGQSLGINHDEALWDCIWENVKEIVAAVLAESFLANYLASPGKHVLKVTTEAAASWLQLVFLWNVLLSS